MAFTSMPYWLEDLARLASLVMVGHTVDFGLYPLNLHIADGGMQSAGC